MSRHLPRPLRPAPASRSSRFSFNPADTFDSPEDPTEDAAQIQEIDEIRRYEDFTTIDWVQDAAHAQLQRRLQRQRSDVSEPIAGTINFKQKFLDTYEAGQAWIVVSLVGAAIGVNAGFLNIVTEWLSDFKLGYCRTAFYLNESFCCWGVEDGCDNWRRWGGVWPVSYAFYVLFSLAFAYASANLVRSFAPYAAGSGISEIKCILAGFIMKGFLGFWTLLIKSIGLPLAIASGLSVGKEGPSVHYAVCTGNVISRFFMKYRKNAAKTREILSACAAAGVAVAFGSPIGGVLFSLEEMSPNFPLKTIWRSYFCALVATAVLAAMNPFRTGQLVMFQVHYDRDWHFFEVAFFIILGIFGGLYGAFVIKWNLKAQAFRKKYLAAYPLGEATALAGITAVLCYPNMFLRIDMTESMEILFRECEGGRDYNGLCEAKHRWRIISSLVLATLLRVALVIISYGCKVPAGIFVPSMAIGASFGRTIGIIVQALHEAFPNSSFFSSCEPDRPCITPGTYAFLGAAAALSGIMHLTVSVVVIMFELTGALTYILPTMIVVGATKAVGEWFGKGGIADRMIWFNGFPFLDNKDEHMFGVPVSETMTRELFLFPASGATLEDIDSKLRHSTVQGFPIVDEPSSGFLRGYIGRTELRYALDRLKLQGSLDSSAKVYFRTPCHEHGVSAVPLAGLHQSLGSTRSGAVDLSRFVDQTPLAVHPHLALETVMEIFKKLGPRVILVEHKGRLLGLLTVKDILKYQIQFEFKEGQRGDAVDTEQFEALWDKISFVVKCVRSFFGGLRAGGKIPTPPTQIEELRPAEVELQVHEGG